MISKIKKILEAEGLSKEIICGLLGNIKLESNFKLVAENLNYSSADRLRAIFPSKFKTMSDEKIKGYVNKPEALGNLVYADKGGFKYRGRGFIQLTGEVNYKLFGELTGVDLVNNPDLLLDEEIATKVASKYVQRMAFPLYKGELNDCKDIIIVADIITRAIQGPAKNYSTGFLKEHLEKKRAASEEFYKNYESI